MSTVTPNKALTEPALNDLGWNTPLNQNFTYVDASLGTTQAVNVTGLSGTTILSSTYPTTPPAYSYIPGFMTLTGTLSSNLTFQVPSTVGGEWTVNNATSGAQAAIRSKYAQMGLSGSSMEQQELSQVNLNAAGAGAQVALNLYSQGISDANISQEIYKTLLSTDVQQQQQTGNAIANMAQALSGGIGGGKAYTIQPTPAG